MMVRLTRMGTCIWASTNMDLQCVSLTSYAGHALNKILKDMINRYKLLRGHRIQWVTSTVHKLLRLML